MFTLSGIDNTGIAKASDTGIHHNAVRTGTMYEKGGLKKGLQTFAKEP